LPPEADQLYEWAFWSQDPVDAIRIAVERRRAAGLTDKEVRGELSELRASLERRRRFEDGQVVGKAMEGLAA
jgi:hypothetical protein